ncbi:hypothetical protein [Streptosporangium sandarakinum]
MSEPVEYAVPVQVIAEALHADFEAAWGPGSGNISAHRATAERAVEALTDAGLVVVSRDDLAETIRDAETCLHDRGSDSESDARLARLTAAVEASPRASEPPRSPAHAPGGTTEPDGAPEASETPTDLRARYAYALADAGELPPESDDADRALDALMAVRDDELEAVRAALARALTYTSHRRGCRADGSGEPCTCGLATLGGPA